MTKKLTEAELRERAERIIGNSIDTLQTLAVAEMEQLMTVTQYVTDLCLAELEDRAELKFIQGLPVVPYVSDYGVETILTRQG